MDSRLRLAPPPSLSRFPTPLPSPFPPVPSLSPPPPFPLPPPPPFPVARLRLHLRPRLPVPLRLCPASPAAPRPGGGSRVVRPRSFRRLQPPPAPAVHPRGPPGTGRAGLRAFLPSRVLRAPKARPQRLGSGSGKWTPFAQTVGSTEAARSRVGPPGKKVSQLSCRAIKMVGFGLLYFFFCSLHF
nr:uncharacterized protein LOC129526240 [Gorilla gorilla gorilla]